MGAADRGEHRGFRALLAVDTPMALSGPTSRPAPSWSAASPRSAASAPFDKLAVARRVFGKEQADEAMQRIADVLGGWGYRIGRAKDQRLPAALGLALLLNRSPRLEDLTTEVFERLRLHPDLSRGQAGALFGIQKAVSSLGFCDPPPAPAHGTMPPIEGTAKSWAGWVERWYATSTLTPRTRGMVRGAMAKAGRWLAAEHPEITEPGQWTRQTCAAWVAAVDRMNIGQ